MDARPCAGGCRPIFGPQISRFPVRPRRLKDGQAVLAFCHFPGHRAPFPGRIQADVKHGLGLHHCFTCAVDTANWLCKGTCVQVWEPYHTSPNGGERFASKMGKPSRKHYEGALSPPVTQATTCQRTNGPPVPAGRPGAFSRPKYTTTERMCQYQFLGLLPSVPGELNRRNKGASHGTGTFCPFVPAHEAVFKSVHPVRGPGRTTSAAKVKIQSQAPAALAARALAARARVAARARGCPCPWYGPFQCGWRDF